MSTIEKALKAKADAEALIQTAIKEQRQIIKEAQRRLAELGESSEGGVEGGGKKPGTKKKRAKSAADCTICNFKTSPPHSNRHHRTQPKNKKGPFTAKELEAKGLKKA
jgi:hypothetical protein